MTDATETASPTAAELLDRAVAGGENGTCRLWVRFLRAHLPHLKKRKAEHFAAALVRAELAAPDPPGDDIRERLQDAEAQIRALLGQRHP
jgi:hypothetical protein